MQSVRDITLAAGMGFSVSQAPILLLMMLYLPEPQATLFKAQLVNGTSVRLVSQDTLGLGPWFLVASLIIALYSFVTHQLQEQQVLDNAVEYSEENIGGAALWNIMFWVLFFVMHVIVAFVVTSPVGWTTVALVVLLDLYSVGSMCQPRGSHQLGTLWTIMYLLATVVVFQESAGRKGAKMIALVLQTMIDLLLVMGHVYDVTTMQTMGNCRLFYTCMSGVTLLLLYS